MIHSVCDAWVSASVSACDARLESECPAAAGASQLTARQFSCSPGEAISDGQLHITPPQVTGEATGATASVTQHAKCCTAVDAVSHYPAAGPDQPRSAAQLSPDAKWMVSMQEFRCLGVAALPG